MKIFVIILNTILFLFTLLVMATDGPPVRAAYITFAIWTQITCILSAITILIIGAGTGLLHSQKNKNTVIEEKKLDIIRTITILFNVIELGFVIWAFIDQYPHPNEEGFIEYITLMVLTPILSMIVLFRCGLNKSWLGLLIKRNEV